MHLQALLPLKRVLLPAVTKTLGTHVNPERAVGFRGFELRGLIMIALDYDSNSSIDICIGIYKLKSKPCRVKLALGSEVYR